MFERRGDGDAAPVELSRDISAVIRHVCIIVVQVTSSRLRSPGHGGVAAVTLRAQNQHLVATRKWAVRAACVATSPDGGVTTQVVSISVV